MNQTNQTDEIDQIDETDKTDETDEKCSRFNIKVKTNIGDKNGEFDGAYKDPGGF